MKPKTYKDLSQIARYCKITKNSKGKVAEKMIKTKYYETPEFDFPKEYYIFLS